MLSVADKALVERDPELPGLAAILDGTTLARRAGLEDLQPTYLRYKHGTSCVVALTRLTGGLHAYAAMSYPPARYAIVRARTEWQRDANRVIYLDDIYTALVPLSCDRDLPSARRIAAAAGLPKRVAGLKLDHHTPQLLRYKPGRRVVLRMNTKNHGDTLVKGYCTASFAHALRGARHAHGVSGVGPIAIDEKIRIIVSRWIAGTAIDPSTADHDAFWSIGAELQRLHSIARRPGSPVAQPDYHSHADAVATLLPDLAEQARELATAIGTALLQTGASGCFIHGDFSADQVLLGIDGPRVVDWDRAEIGDPARDLGSFLAQLDRDVIEGRLAPDLSAAAAEALLEGYRLTAGQLPPGVTLQRAAALLALLPEGFRSRRPHWQAESEATLARVEVLLSAHDPSRTTITYGLARALDPVTMGPLLGELTATTARNTSVKTELLRLRAGRRALIRYQLTDLPLCLGKLRVKGLDSRTPALHKILRGAGLDGRAPDFVGVPEPLGTLDDPPLWIQRLVPGRPLTELLGGAKAPRSVARCAHALACLHRADAPSDRTWTMQDELAVLERALAQAVAAGAASDEEAAQIFNAILTPCLALPASLICGIHRDFYPDQVLIDGDAVWIVDLDLFARGDAMLDVGNFLAHLTEYGLRTSGDPTALAAEAEAFLHGYAAVHGTLDRHRIDILHWVSLARHIGISQRFDARMHTTRALIALCMEGPSAIRFSALKQCAQ